MFTEEVAIESESSVLRARSIFSESDEFPPC